METLAPTLLESGFPACFQFVKRMNGNEAKGKQSADNGQNLLPIREAYEWKPIGYTL